MTSAVDTALPSDNVKVSKSDFRAQFVIIKNEITALQTRTSVAGAEAFNNGITATEVQRLINNAILADNTRNRLPSSLAYGSTSFTISNN
jgi:hypothetical protein